MTPKMGLMVALEKGLENSGGSVKIILDLGTGCRGDVWEKICRIGRSHSRNHTVIAENPLPIDPLKPE